MRILLAVFCPVLNVLTWLARSFDLPLVHQTWPGLAIQLSLLLIREVNELLLLLEYELLEFYFDFLNLLKLLLRLHVLADDLVLLQQFLELVNLDIWEAL